MEILMKPATHSKFTYHSTALAFLAALAAFALSAFSSDPVLAQQAGDTTFRLLTFEVADSGPRLGTTRGSGDQDVVDVHNAITYLYRSGAPEQHTKPNHL